MKTIVEYIQKKHISSTTIRSYKDVEPEGYFRAEWESLDKTTTLWSIGKCMEITHDEKMGTQIKSYFSLAQTIPDTKPCVQFYSRIGTSDNVTYKNASEEDIELLDNIYKQIKDLNIYNDCVLNKSSKLYGIYDMNTNKITPYYNYL